MVTTTVRQAEFLPVLGMSCNAPTEYLEFLLYGQFRLRHLPKNEIFSSVHSSCWAIPKYLHGVIQILHTEMPISLLKGVRQSSMCRIGQVIPNLVAVVKNTPCHQPLVDVNTTALGLGFQPRSIYFSFSGF